MMMSGAIWPQSGMTVENPTITYGCTMYHIATTLATDFDNGTLATYVPSQTEPSFIRKNVFVGSFQFKHSMRTNRSNFESATERQTYAVECMHTLFS